MPLDIDAYELEELYASNTAGEIASELGVSQSTVRYYLKKYGIRKSRFILREFSPEEEEQSIRQEMLAAFDNWASSNMRGYDKSGRSIIDSLQDSDLDYEGEDSWQINSLGTNRVTMKGRDDIKINRNDIKIRFDANQRRLTVIIKGKTYHP
jgi:predicted transcriptional regulator